MTVLRRLTGTPARPAAPPKEGGARDDGAESLFNLFNCSCWRAADEAAIDSEVPIKSAVDSK